MPVSVGEPQVGWYGKSIESDGSGVFGSQLYIEFTFNPRLFNSVYISGDTIYNEYPVDFTLSFRVSGVETNINVSNNSQIKRVVDFDTIENVDRLRVTITKWSAPNTIVKITEIAGIFSDVYLDDEISFFDILEETNSNTGSVPIGNFSSNELDISLLNENRKFSFGNTESIYPALLQSGKQVNVWIGFVLPMGSSDESGDVDGYIVDNVNGVKIGYMPYSNYYSTDWNTSFNSQLLTSSCYDVSQKLREKDFKTSLLYSGSVSSIIDKVMFEATNDIKNLKWEVSSDLNGENWDLVYFPIKSFFETIKDICEATYSYAYVNRLGVLVIGDRLNVSTPLVDSASQTLDMDNYFSYGSRPVTDEIVNRVSVNYTTYFYDPNITNPDRVDLYRDNDVQQIPSGESFVEVYLEYSESPAVIDTIDIDFESVSGDPIITDVKLYAVGALIKISGSSLSSFKLAITGHVYKISYNGEYVEENAESVKEYGVRLNSIKNNQLITNIVAAWNIATGILSEYNSMRNDAQCEFPGNTIVSVGDTVELTEFKNDTVETKDYFLIKRQKITFDGSLRSSVDLRRG